MADDKQGRDKQAHDAERRQRERAIQAELERYDETEPPVDDAELDEIEEELETVSFPRPARRSSTPSANDASRRGRRRTPSGSCSPTPTSRRSKIRTSSGAGSSDRRWRRR
nr:hypothetical protein [Halolamina pelagica]